MDALTRPFNKICLINPPTTPPIQELFFPMGLVAVGSFLKSKGFEVEIADFDLQIRKDATLPHWPSLKNRILEKLAETRAQVFGISSICLNYPVSLLLAKEIRQRWPSSKIILGGPQPSAVAEETLAFAPWLDAIVVGEGENSLLELMSGDWSRQALDKTGGIVFRDGKEIVRTRKRELIEDLDELPFPDFSLLAPLEEYHSARCIPALVEAGRGCPFTCSFCSTALMWEQKYRAKSPARILEEMRKIIRQYGSIQQCFPLTHDNFTTSPRYVDQFCEFMKKNNKEGLYWSVSARPDTVNPERIKNLFDAGCRGLFFGVDTGSQKMQKTIRKHLKLSKFEPLLQSACDLGIAATASFVVGYPEETMEDLNSTLSLALRSKWIGARVVQVHRLSPLGGTPVYSQNKEGLFYQRQNQSDICSEWFMNPEMEEMIVLQKVLFSSFYTIPSPQLGDLNLGNLATFYNWVFTFFSPALQEVYGSTTPDLIDLFQKWEAWGRANAPYGGMEFRSILNQFEGFLKETVGPLPVYERELISDALGN